MEKEGARRRARVFQNADGVIVGDQVASTAPVGGHLCYALLQWFQAPALKRKSRASPQRGETTLAEPSTPEVLGYAGRATPRSRQRFTQARAHNAPCPGMENPPCLDAI